ncbi:hypothetical protein HYC85_028476 [Camellia sinensis]|uniref:Uncharacterized protein n=1 Tax=Camellia sinensis TaxID=4442 RepID=A0A7J7FVD4_CAMSI|nr:hypothetical protein HYC85_028476 [Camellia sinensis]
MGLPYRVQAEVVLKQSPHPWVFKPDSSLRNPKPLCSRLCHSNSSFHRLSWSPKNSLQTQLGGYTRPSDAVRARLTPKELHL